MLRKIVSIKNVGRFRNSAASGNLQLAKHVFIAGANGFGKTTICAVLRSLHTGDPSQGRDAQRGVMVEATPSPPFEMAEPDLLPRRVRPIIENIQARSGEARLGPLLPRRP
jgi:translation initiation factor RLI1